MVGSYYDEYVKKLEARAHGLERAIQAILEDCAFEDGMTALVCETALRGDYDYLYEESKDGKGKSKR